jgi:hypothetical protein
MIGRLIWNHDRPDIAFDTGALYGGLHCGDCFQCWMDGQWLNVRLEYTCDWVLLHSGGSMPVRYGVLVRI